MFDLRSPILTLALLPLFALACSSDGPRSATSSGGASSGSAGSGGRAGSSATDLGGSGGAAANSGEAGRANSAGDGQTGDDALISPPRISLTPLAGGTGVLNMFALTLHQGPNNVEVYAALKNVGDVYACAATISVELYDADQLSLTAEVGGAFTRHLYQRTDGSGAIASCVAPGEVTMAAITNFSTEVAVEDVYYVVYRSPYFQLDVTDIGGFEFDHVTIGRGGAGTSYAGDLINGLDFAVDAPSVSIFPVNRVGRPLGMASASGTGEVAPGARWHFETNGVAAMVDDYVAFGSANSAN